MKRTRKILSLVGAAIMLATITGAAPTEDANAPGEQQLVNFAHVYNFKPNSSGIDPTGRGTDIEFFTSDVPKRDYATGELLNKDGMPLLEGEEPVIEPRDFAVMGTYLAGGWIFDITNPEQPQFVKQLVCPGATQNDIQLKKFESKWIAVLSADEKATCHTPRFGPGTLGGISLFDVTEPYFATKLFSFRTVGGAHNFTFHPTKPFGVVSTGQLPGAANTTRPGRDHIPVLNFSNVLATPPSSANVTQVADIEVPGGGPHDISFTPDGNRMFVANENNGIIFDTTDPAAPVQVGITPNAGTYFHGFDPTPNGKIALATNESLALGGFLVGGTTMCPGEGITFYNVEGDNAKAPVPVGHFLASVQGPVSPKPSTSPPGAGLDDRACTAHVGEIAPNNKIYTTGWYVGGARVVDFGGLPQMPPREVGIAQMADAEVWAAKFHKGNYLYTADMRRGFDVFRWTGGDTAPWLAP